MKKILLFLLLGLTVRATEVTDLGQGLSYLRVHAVADTVKAVAGSGALVLDLRHATADEASAAALQAALTRRGSSPSSLFFLVSPDTPAVLVPIIGKSSAVTLGAPGSVPAPKVIVATDAATDRRAYDAVETGTPLDQLITGKVDKERFDEATLVEQFKNGNPDAEPPPAPDPSAPKTEDAPVKPAPLVDRVLQRAVHLHHALQALRR